MVLTQRPCVRVVGPVEASGSPGLPHIPRILRRQMKAPVWVVLILLFRARIAPVCKKVFL
jgi:hypothetical protein